MRPFLSHIFNTQYTSSWQVSTQQSSRLQYGLTPKLPASPKLDCFTLSPRFAGDNLHSTHLDALDPSENDKFDTFDIGSNEKVALMISSPLIDLNKPAVKRSRNGKTLMHYLVNRIGLTADLISEAIYKGGNMRQKVKNHPSPRDILKTELHAAGSLSSGYGRDYTRLPHQIIQALSRGKVPPSEAQQKDFEMAAIRLVLEGLNNFTGGGSKNNAAVLDEILERPLREGNKILSNKQQYALQVLASEEDYHQIVNALATAHEKQQLVQELREAQMTQEQINQTLDYQNRAKAKSSTAH